MKKILVFPAALALVSSLATASSVAFAQDTPPLTVTKVKLRADAPVLFAPRGWKIENQVSGDLNRDKIADKALVLVEDKPAKDKEGNAASRRRALVIVVREGKGWCRAGFSGTILQGTRDGGAFYGVVEAPATVSISRGVLNIEQESGSREVSNRTHRFRLDRRTQRFYLIGSEFRSYDRVTGDVMTTSTNYLTGIQRETTIKAPNDRTIVKTSRVNKKLRQLEALTEDQRYLA